jgi:hypothetical protein
MRSDFQWIFNGRVVSGPRHAVLGRRNWYSAFANQLTASLGTKVYLFEFMHWLDESDPEASLSMLIETADRLDVHLKGIPIEDVRKATVGFGKRARRRADLTVTHMSTWEINQIYHGGHLGRSVRDERIMHTTLQNSPGLNGRPMTTEEIEEAGCDRGSEVVSSYVGYGSRVCGRTGGEIGQPRALLSRRSRASRPADTR